jgi:NADP-dependent 3-hydroxy acid dehydrogenase YdfG
MSNTAQPEGQPKITPEELANAALWILEQPSHVCIRDLVITPTNYGP